jgi:hypothetical protein
MNKHERSVLRQSQNHATLCNQLPLKVSLASKSQLVLLIDASWLAGMHAQMFHAGHNSQLSTGVFLTRAAVFT